MNVPLFCRRARDFYAIRPSLMAYFWGKSFTNRGGGGLPKLFSKDSASIILRLIAVAAKQAEHRQWRCRACCTAKQFLCGCKARQCRLTQTWQQCLHATDHLLSLSPQSEKAMGWHPLEPARGGATDPTGGGVGLQAGGAPCARAREYHQPGTPYEPHYGHTHKSILFLLWGRLNTPDLQMYALPRSYRMWEPHIPSESELSGFA